MMESRQVVGKCKFSVSFFMMLYIYVQFVNVNNVFLREYCDRNYLISLDP